MFTSRYDSRLWNPHLIQEFPNLTPTTPINKLRRDIYNELEQIRKLRNRIAHHEPIFNRNLIDDFQNITDLINSRCKITATWMIENQQALTLINARPQLTKTPDRSGLHSPFPPKNRTCEFPSIRLKPFKSRVCSTRPLISLLVDILPPN